MNQIEKLEIVIKEWESKAENLSKESSFCRDHNFLLESQMLHQKSQLIDQMCRSIRLKVIEELVSL